MISFVNMFHLSGHIAEFVMISTKIIGDKSSRGDDSRERKCKMEYITPILQ